MWTGVDGGADGRRRGWKMKGSETRVWTGLWMEDGGERDWVWTGVDKRVDGRRRGGRLGVDGCGRVWMEDVDGRWRGARLGEDWVWTGVWMEEEGERDWVRDWVWGCGQECGWKMKGSESGRGRLCVDGRRRGARLGVDGGVDGRRKENEIGCEAVWTGVDGRRWGCGRGCGMEDGGERGGCGRVWTRVWVEDEARLGVKRNGCQQGGWTTRLGVDGCGQGCGWKMKGMWVGDGGERDGARIGCWTGVWIEDKGSETGVDGCWTGVWMEDEIGSGRVWIGVWAEDGVDGGRGCGRGWRGARLGVDGCGRGCGWKMKG